MIALWVILLGLVIFIVVLFISKKKRKHILAPSTIASTIVPERPENIAPDAPVKSVELCEYCGRKIQPNIDRCPGCGAPINSKN